MTEPQEVMDHAQQLLAEAQARRLARAESDGKAGPLLALDLGCGMRPEPGYEGVDVADFPGVRYHSNLTLIPWVLRNTEGHRIPLADGSVERIYTRNLVEQVPDLVAFMCEASRVLCPDGLMTIRHPYQFSALAWSDPHAVRAIAEPTWYYFSRDYRTVNAMPDIACDFEVASITPETMSPEYGDATPEAFGSAIRKFNNVVFEFTVQLLRRGP